MSVLDEALIYSNSNVITICLTLFIFFGFFHFSSGTEGQGQMLIQTVKLAFSITNNVIRLKPSSSSVSPLEQALTQHGMWAW